MGLKDKWRRARDWRLQHPAMAGRKTLRWCASVADGCPGWIIDGYGDLIVANRYVDGDVDKDMAQLESVFPNCSIFLKARRSVSRHGKSAAPSGRSSGFDFLVNDSFVEGRDHLCEENGVKFWVRPTEEHDNGLFLDTYAARQWLRANVEGKRVLNLFAYTCAFGVVAQLGGATHLTNIDPQQDYLDWGKRNAQLNGVDFRNLRDTTQKYLGRHVRRVSEGKDEPYDIVVTDPPAFLVGRGGDRLGRKIWPSMLKQMEDSGCRHFLTICNDKSFLAKRSWHPFLKSHLGFRYRIYDLDQSEDVLGQMVVREDPHYRAPVLTVVERVA